MANRVVFLDTSGFFAWINQRDPNHQAMVALPHEPGCRLVTTDYILDETLTLFMARGIPHQRKRLLAMVSSSTILKVVWIGQEHFREATEGRCKVCGKSGKSGAQLKLADSNLKSWLTCFLPNNIVNCFLFYEFTDNLRKNDVSRKNGINGRLVESSFP
jgi:hypothetical protein